jgi:hypothetical protein
MSVCMFVCCLELVGHLLQLVGHMLSTWMNMGLMPDDAGTSATPATVELDLYSLTNF